MAFVVTLIGVLLIAGALVDVFQTLFHPAGRGGMSDWTAKLTWRAFRLIARKRPHVLTYAGPTAILLIIVSWAGLTWVGFALIYMPQLANGFEFSHATGGSAHQGIVEALSARPYECRSPRLHVSLTTSLQSPRLFPESNELSTNVRLSRVCSI